MQAANMLFRGGIVALVFLFSPGLSAQATPWTPEEDNLRISDAYSIQSKPSSITLVKQEAGYPVEYPLQGFHADVVLQIRQGRNFNELKAFLSSKYHLEDTDCRRQLKHTLNVLEAWGIVIRGSGSDF